MVLVVAHHIGAAMGADQAAGSAEVVLAGRVRGAAQRQLAQAAQEQRLHATRSTRIASSTEVVVRSTPSISPISSSSASRRCVLGVRSTAR